MGTRVRVRLRNVLLRGPKILVNGDAPEADVEQPADDENADHAHFVGLFRLPEQVRSADAVAAIALPLLWCLWIRVVHSIRLYRNGSHIDNLVPNA